MDYNSAEHEKKLRLEIEVKLILPENIFSQVKDRKGIKKKDIEQIYLTPNLVGQFSKELSLPADVIFKEWRVRRTDHKHTFTAKSKPGKKGVQRTEYQTGISDSLFSAIKNLAYSKGSICQVQKTRYSFLADFAEEQVSVEIDDYHATGKGTHSLDFVSCEVEVSTPESAEMIIKGSLFSPDLLFMKQGINVTGIREFSNRFLAEHGFVADSYSDIVEWVRQYYCDG